MGEDDEEEKPGDTYEGNMEHGIRQGQGTYTWGINGAVYVGEYVNNKKHGKGKMTFPDKGVYEGKGLWDRDGGAPGVQSFGCITSAQQAPGCPASAWVHRGYWPHCHTGDVKSTVRSPPDTSWHRETRIKEKALHSVPLDQAFHAARWAQPQKLSLPSPSLPH